MGAAVGTVDGPARSSVYLAVALVALEGKASVNIKGTMSTEYGQP